MCLYHGYIRVKARDFDAILEIELRCLRGGGLQSLALPDASGFGSTQ
jgi:hypothetical protein